MGCTPCPSSRLVQRPRWVATRNACGSRSGRPSLATRPSGPRTPLGHCPWPSWPYCKTMTCVKCSTSCLDVATSRGPGTWETPVAECTAGGSSSQTRHRPRARARTLPWCGCSQRWVPRSPRKKSPSSFAMSGSPYSSSRTAGPLRTKGGGDVCPPHSRPCVETWYV